MAKIRILFIDVRADLGGGSKHLQAIIKNLDREKIEIYVASPSGQALSDEFKSVSQNCIHIPFRKFSFRALLRLKKFSEKNQINFIHSHGRGAGIYSRFLSFLIEIPVIHTFHGVSDQARTLKSLLSLWAERLLAFQTARFIHVSESERDFACQLQVSDRDRSVVIKNGIDLEQFSKSETLRQKAREELGFNENHFVVGCVARFDLCKRQEDLILALNKLVLRHPNIRLVLVGSGDTESRTKQLINDKALAAYTQIHAPRSEVETFYAALDLFVLPSLHEGLPLAPIEAMASGCPVLLTDVRGNRDVVTHQKTGILVPVRNPQLLANAIENIIQNYSLRMKLAESGKKFVQEHFNQKQMIEKTRSFYLELCPIPEIRKTVLVHDWLFHMRGGEKVLEAIGELFPTAPIYTLFLNKSKLSPSLRKHRIISSWLSNLPNAEKYYRYLLPIFPFVIKQLHLKKANLIISSSHCVAKGARAKKGLGVHVCYCHAPMRYVWGFSKEYFGNYSLLKQKLIQMVTSFLKRWDLETNRTVDYFVANSENVRARIKNFYGREADVVYPPIAIGNQTENKQAESEDFYLVVSALVPYKRVDLAVEAFSTLSTKLVVIGDGPLYASLKSKAHEGTQFLGWQNDDQVADYYQRCKALVFPTEEDFGMVPVEAMSWGKPVIAYGKGGALETVIPALDKNEAKKATGVLFDHQTAESLREAIERFESYEFDHNFIKRHAQKFERQQFVKEMREFIVLKMAYHGSK